jgi:hypothetical protein
MNEIESNPPIESTDTEDYYIKEYLRLSDAQWCLRRLALIATRRLDGDPEDAAEMIYQSGGGLDAKEASCYKRDCHVRTSISKLADNTPEGCTSFIEVLPVESSTEPKPIESL